MLILILILIFIVSITINVYGGNIQKNTLVQDIMLQLSQYSPKRVNKYLELNNINNIIKKHNIKNCAQFFEIENINANSFYTGLQQELLKQNPGKKFKKKALTMSDTELLAAYESNIKIFKN